MIKKEIKQRTCIRKYIVQEGETIEQKIERVVNNKEPIEDGAPLIWTERKEGVKPEYNIRTDRWDIAIDGMDNVSKANIAKRMEYIRNQEPAEREEKSEGEA